MKRDSHVKEVEEVGKDCSRMRDQLFKNQSKSEYDVLERSKCI